MEVYKTNKYLYNSYNYNNQEILSDDYLHNNININPDIENEAINVSNMEAAFTAPDQYETSAMSEAQLNLTERIIEEQKKLRALYEKKYGTTPAKI